MKSRWSELPAGAKRLTVLVAIGLLVGSLLVAISSVNLGPFKGESWFDSLELKAYDWMTGHFGYPIVKEGHHGCQSIAMISIDQESIEQIGPWPWDRSLHARLVDILAADGAKVIALDILFSSPASAAGDDALALSIENAGNVVLASAFSGWSKESYEALKIYMPLALFADAAAGVGFTNIPADQDGVNRRVRLTQSIGGEHYSSFSLDAVVTGGVLGTEEQALDRIPASGEEELLVNFSKDFYRNAPIYSFNEVISGHYTRGVFKGMTVFVGLTGGAKIDAFPTPISGKETPTPGVEIHARAAATMESGAFVRPCSWWLGRFIVVLVALLVILLFYGRRLWLSAFVAVALLVLLPFAGGFVFGSSGLWLPLFTPVTAGVLVLGGGISYRYFAEVRKEKKLRETFGKYVSDGVLAELLKDPESASVEGRLVEASVLFSDVRGFTTLSESMEPPQVVEVLNSFLTAVSEVILEHGGMIDKFVGDEVMAIFGAPIEADDHAIRACRAALGIQEVLKEFEEASTPAVQAGVGINSGHIVVGSIGHEKRLEYTAVGDAVNVASRLEGLTREVGADIVIGRRTMELAEESIEVRALGEIKVKGKEKPLQVFALEGIRE